MGQGATAFLLGILAFQQMPVLPAAAWGGLILPLLPLGARYHRLRLPVMFACGFLWTLVHANHILATGLPPALEGQDVLVEGRVADLPQRRDRGLRFEFDTERLLHHGQEQAVPGRVRLTWYGAPPPLRAGERWRLTVRLKRPRGFMNPGGPDYEAWLYRHRIRATGYVRSAPGNQRLDRASPGYALQRLRQQLGEGIRGALGEARLGGLITALAIGDRQGIGPGHWETLTRTGTNHLVAISGLHVGLVAGLAFFVLRGLWARSGRGALWRPAPRVAAVGAVCAAAVYAALAGFSVPTQRALIMVAVIMGAVLLQRHRTRWHTLMTALLLVLLYDPLAVMESGFWLSFTAVGVILFGMGGRVAPRGWWWRWGRLHLLIAVGLAPLMLILFQRIPLIAPLANFIAVPWVGIGVVPLVLLGALLLPVSPSLGGLCLQAAQDVLAGLWFLLERLSAIDSAQWTQHVPPAWTIVPAALGAAALIAPRGLPGRWLGVIGLLPALTVMPPRPAPGAASFTLLDVGQGLAAVVETRGHVLVYDTGARFSAGFDAGRAVLLPFLRHRGIAAIDTLVIGHGDNDHIGGAAALHRAVTVGRVISSVPEKIPWWHAGHCRDGQGWHWDGVSFTILHPPARAGFRGNNGSCVLRVSAGGGTVLLTGDIERGAEARLVREQAQALAAQILVAPHHGSKTSSSAAFIDAVDPAYVLFPVGYRNRWNFPRPVVRERYRAAGAALYDTARHGAITFDLPARGAVEPPVTWRQSRHHYWNGG